MPAALRSPLAPLVSLGSCALTSALTTRRGAQGLPDRARATAVFAAVTLVFGAAHSPPKAQPSNGAAVEALAHFLICEAGHGAIFSLEQRKQQQQVHGAAGGDNIEDGLGDPAPRSAAAGGGGGAESQGDGALLYAGVVTAPPLPGQLASALVRPPALRSLLTLPAYPSHGPSCLQQQQPAADGAG